MRPVSHWRRICVRDIGMCRYLQYPGLLVPRSRQQILAGNPVAANSSITDQDSFGRGLSSPRSFAARLRISTPFSSSRILLRAFANSMPSGVVMPGSTPRSIWVLAHPIVQAALADPQLRGDVIDGLPRTKQSNRAYTKFRLIWSWHVS